MLFSRAIQALVLVIFASTPVFAGAIAFDDGVEASGGHIGGAAVTASHWVKIPRNIEDILERRERKGKQNRNLSHPANRNQQRAAEPKAEPQRKGKGKGNLPPPNGNQQRGAEAEPQQEGKGIGTRSPLLDRAQQREVEADPQQKGKTNGNRPPLGNRNQQRQAPGQGNQSPSPPTSTPSDASTPPAKLDQRQGKGGGGARPHQ